MPHQGPHFALDFIGGLQENIPLGGRQIFALAVLVAKAHELRPRWDISVLAARVRNRAVNTH